MDTSARSAIRLILLAPIVALVVAGVVLLWRTIHKLIDAPNLLDSFNQELARRSGHSIYQVRAIVIIATIPLFIALIKFFKKVPLIWHGSLGMPHLLLYTNVYGLVIVVYIAAFNYALYWAGRYDYADKWCAPTREGITVMDGPGKELVYGVLAHPCEQNEIAKLREPEVGNLQPRPLLIPDPENFAFYSNGQPNVWYAQSPDGMFRFYDRAGSDPLSNHPLAPVDDNIRTEVIRQFRLSKTRSAITAAASKAARFVNPISGSPVTDDTAAIVDLSDHGANEMVADLLAQEMTKDGIQLRSVFRSAFVSEGRARELFQGNWESVSDLRLRDRVAFVFVYDEDASYELSQEMENLVTATTNLKLRCFDMRRHRSCGQTSIASSGAGFSRATALRASFERAAPEIQNFVRARGH